MIWKIKKYFIPTIILLGLSFLEFYLLKKNSQQDETKINLFQYVAPSIGAALGIFGIIRCLFDIKWSFLFKEEWWKIIIILNIIGQIVLLYLINHLYKLLTTGIILFILFIPMLITIASCSFGIRMIIKRTEMHSNL